jgi:hypothetical protein
VGGVEDLVPTRKLAAITDQTREDQAGKTVRVMLSGLLSAPLIAGLVFPTGAPERESKPTSHPRSPTPLHPEHPSFILDCRRA